ncbi:hypothetical protein ACVPOR_07670 [Staphylococcus aureus]
MKDKNLALPKQIIIRNKSQIDMFEEMIKEAKRMLMMLCYPFMDETIKQMTT